MKSVKVSEKYRVTLKKPYAWEYNNNVIGAYKTSPFLRAVEDIDGVIDVEYDFACETNLFVTIDANYCWNDIRELIRTLSNE